MARRVFNSVPTKENSVVFPSKYTVSMRPTVWANWPSFLMFSNILKVPFTAVSGKFSAVGVALR